MTFSFCLTKWEYILDEDASSDVETRTGTLRELLEADDWSLPASRTIPWEALLTATEWFWPVTTTTPVNGDALTALKGPEGYHYTFPVSVGGVQLGMAAFLPPGEWPHTMKSQMEIFLAKM